MRAEGCDTSGCASLEVKLESFPDPAIAVNGENPICLGGNTKLYPAAIETKLQPGQSANTLTTAAYTWTRPNNTQLSFPEGTSRPTSVNVKKEIAEIFANSPGVYTLITSYGPPAQCRGTSTIEIIAFPAIDNNIISSPQTICINATPAVLTGSTPTGGNGSYTYRWEKSTTSATSTFSTAAGVTNEINYSPPALSQKTWFRRIVFSCAENGTNNISNAIEITTVSTSLGDPSTPEGETTVCAGRSSGQYTTSANNAVSYVWEVTGGTVQGEGTTGRVSWNGPTGQYEVSVVAVGCDGRRSDKVTLEVTKVFCEPSHEFICRLTGRATPLCYLSLSQVFGSLMMCSGNPRTFCPDLRKWKFHLEDLDVRVRVELVATTDPAKPGRILASSVYKNKRISIPEPKTMKLRDEETLWLRFVPLATQKNKEVKIIFSKVPAKAISDLKK